MGDLVLENSQWECVPLYWVLENLHCIKLSKKSFIRLKFIDSDYHTILFYTENMLTTVSLKIFLLDYLNKVTNTVVYTVQFTKLKTNTSVTTALWKAAVPPREDSGSWKGTYRRYYLKY